MVSEDVPRVYPLVLITVQQSQPRVNDKPKESMTNAVQLVTERWSSSGVSEATRSYATPLARSIRDDDTPLGVANTVNALLLLGCY